MSGIIIDGVNVAECEYYKGKCMEYMHYCQIGCKECTDIGTKLCHYKQTERFKAKIARLEQENKELKEENFNWEQINKLQEKYKSALEEIRTFAKPIKENSCFGLQCGFIDFVLETIREALNE